MRRMIGRILAFGGWMAWQVSRRLATLPAIGPRVARYGATGVAALLLLLAAVPFIIPLFDAQPQTITVQAILDGRTHDADAWVRLSGNVVELETSPTGAEGAFALLADRINPLRSVVVEGDIRPLLGEQTNVTGRLTEAIVVIDTDELPIEATVAGTPPTIVNDRVVLLDAAPKAERVSLWPLSILPLLAAILVFIGGRIGYPVFRESFEVDVLAGPLAAGERVPAAFGGRVGSNRAELSEPGAVLFMVRRGPKGNVLTAQPLAEAGPAPAPVTIGGGWTSGKTGYVYTVTETVPAMVVRSAEVDATFLFAKPSERDRIAALIAVGR